MAWEVWWALVLGFAISAIVQAWVPRERIERALSGAGARPVGARDRPGRRLVVLLLRGDRDRQVAVPEGRLAASALAFQFASTNLVWELGLVLWVLIGWQFTLAEYVGGIVMIVLMWRAAAAVRLAARSRQQAREHADAGRHRPPAPHGRRADELARAARARPRRGRTWPTTSAATGRCSGRRSPSASCWPASSRQLGDDFFNGLFIENAPALLGDARERDRRAADRRAVLRLLDRQRAPGRRAVVGRDQLRGRARVPVRRPDRDPDRRDLPQVLRHRASRCGSSP